ncbi:MAG: nuclease A inhibitor family protein [Acidobacteriota bacterium]
MTKQKKKIKISKEKVTNENGLAENIKKITEGMYYTSESDAEIVPFVGSKVETITDQEILKENNSPAETPLEERDFAEFFDNLTKMQDWFGEEEKTTAEKFAELKELLESDLNCLKVYKIGKIQLDIYVVGLDSENNIVGIKTKAVET